MNGSEADAGLRNDAAGSIGVSVQAGAIHGDVHVHQSDPARVVPRQLPRAVRHFVNRAVEQDALTTVLGAPVEGASMLATVDGVAGVGKSTLAVHWAHGMRERFPDGDLYINLRGFDPADEPVSVADALSSFLTALDVPAERIPENLADREALLRTKLHDRRMLLLLDNARAVDQVRPLLPGNQTSAVVVTSRNWMVDLVTGEGASRIALDVLDDSEARGLLSGYIDAQRLESAPGAVNTLIEHCAGLPLALGIVGARAVEDPSFPLDELVAELKDERERLDSLDAGGQTGIRSVFSWSYRSLSPDAARVFRLLGLPTGPDISLAATADLAGIPKREARKLLGELSGCHLVEQHSPGRYQFHDLLRAYASECASHDETEETRRDAVQRLLDHYLRTSRGIKQRILSHTQYFSPEPPPSEVAGLTFDDTKAGQAWWDAEKANLLAAIRQASKLGFPEHTWQLSLSLMYFFHTRSHGSDWIASHNIALGAARQLGERSAEAYLLHELGVAHHDRAEFETSTECREQSLVLFEELGDSGGQSDALIGLGHSYIDTGRTGDAAECFQRALALARESGDRYDEGQARFGLGRGHLTEGEFEQAVPWFVECLACYDEVGESYGRGFGLNMLADCYQGSGRTSDAVDTYHQALAQFRDLGHRLGEAISLRGLGSTLGPDDPATGDDYLRQALAIFDDLGHPDADDLR